MPEPGTRLWCWRHPKARGAAGRCIGRPDLTVDPRKAKRLAHRIRAPARREGLPHEVCVSPLRRAGDVGRWLARWGFHVQVDGRLAEMDFGRWDGCAWADIAWAEVQAWEADFLHHRPGGGESVQQLAQRVRAFVAESSVAGAAPRLVVTHGGWLNALLYLADEHAVPQAAAWPAAPPHGALRRWPLVR